MGTRAGGLTAEEFVAKWSKAQLSERAASHEHFLDLCHLLDQPTPAEADATGEDYCFEKHVKVVGSASKGSKGDYGFVDVWKRGFFAWEYKGKDKHKTLDEAYRQVYQYRDALDNPPLTVVCDISTIEIRAHFNNYPTEKTVIKLEELPGRLEVLRRVFSRPETFKPEKTREELTGDLAKVFGDLADRILDRAETIPATLFHGHGDPVAHFLMKVMFCLFAEDVGLLPEHLFTRLIDRSRSEPESFAPFCAELFERMKKGGWYGNDRVDYFNGGLFDEAPPLSLKAAELSLLAKAAARPWQSVEPSIFGTLFERILDPKKRAQIGAHYTSKSDILLVIDPVIMTPLRRKWAAVQQAIAPYLDKVVAEKDPKKRQVLTVPVRQAIEEFRLHLGDQRILDPACGSGNFLYVALQQMLDLDDEIVRYVKRYDIDVNPLPYIRPTQLHGIEINPYAAELAQVVVWIGYLQWIAEHKVTNDKRPILDKLVTIKNEDAILDLSKPNLPTPTQWDEVDFIIGNPPFLSGSKIWEGLGTEYRDALWNAYDLPGTVDLCCYWFELARRAVATTKGARAGLLATQGIRGEANRSVLERIKRDGDVFLAWSDRNWVLDGASVHVSIVGFDDGGETVRTLDGASVPKIHADLTTGLDLTVSKRIDENANLSFSGTKKSGPFELPYITARGFLSAPSNPDGTNNTDVLKPWLSGDYLNRRWEGQWIIDFGVELDKVRASLYERPFEYVLKNVKPDRDKNKRERRKDNWWLHAETSPGMRNALAPLSRFLATLRVSKHRLFRWAPSGFLADDGTYTFAREDDYFFGVVQSSVDELWVRRKNSQLREADSGSRYTATSSFETFPLPWPPRKEDVKHPAYLRIAEAAKALNEQRERWLNPPEWIEMVAAKDARLKKRTLTNLYNERPTWLKLAHEQLDRSVLAAYAATNPAGEWSENWAEVWTDTGAGQPLPADHPLAANRTEIDQKVLANLLRLNHARAKGTNALASTEVEPATKPRRAGKSKSPKGS